MLVIMLYVYLSKVIAKGYIEKEYKKHILIARDFIVSKFMIFL
mgnify:CR=1 FL=1